MKHESRLKSYQTYKSQKTYLFLRKLLHDTLSPKARWKPRKRKLWVERVVLAKEEEKVIRSVKGWPRRTAVPQARKPGPTAEWENRELQREWILWILKIKKLVMLEADSAEGNSQLCFRNGATIGDRCIEFMGSTLIILWKYFQKSPIWTRFWMLTESFRGSGGGYCRLLSIPILRLRSEFCRR